jgi:hypothetical protein
MMIANEWTDIEAEETGACYLWPSWSDRRGFVTVRRQSERVEISFEYRGPAQDETRSNVTIAADNENDLYVNWLTFLREVTTTSNDPLEDYQVFINAVSGTVAAFAGSGAR